MKTTTEMQLVPITKLVPYVNNARTHSPEQINKLRSSLREFGFINPVIIDRDYGVIAGHGRILAAKEEGIAEVPCVFADHLTEAQKKAYIIADNRMAMDAGWDEELLRVEIESLQAADFDPLLTGFDEKELSKLFDDGIEAEEDDFDVDAELQKPTFSKPGDVWTLGRHRLICGDSTKEETYEAQVDYYTQYIKRNPEWEFVKVYTDEGISGTNTKHRIGFNEMIADAMSGKIDLIVTKSVSRFARNTVDSLVTIRKLKEKGVEVYFEKENIYTFDGKGELLLTIMSSLAQEESRSISENVTWGQRKRFADGKVNLPYKQFLGYRKGADGFPEVVPEEAIVVHRIYTRFMEGLTPGAIAKELTADGIPTPSRKQRWQTSTVESILQNEKYKGAALLQKCFTVDFLTKKRKVNEGEVPQYYVEHSHEPIITPEEFDKVQTELARRKQISRQYSGKSILSSRIVCGDCGSYFGSKVWNSTSKYRRVIWQCNGKFKGEHKCETPHLDEETIKARFVTALNAIIESKDNILEDCRLMQATLTDCTGIDTEIESLLEEIDVVTELTKRCIAENSQMAQNQEEYAARYNGFVERYEKAKARLEQLRTTKAAREAQAEAIGAFMFEVQELDALTEFDEKLWLTIIDTITVHADGRMTFKFQGGTEIEA